MQISAPPLRYNFCSPSHNDCFWWLILPAEQLRMALHTRLTDLLSIEHPIISAPMAFAAGGILAAAITGGGGLGLIGGGYGDSEWLEREFSEARNARIGCGFITWSLAKRPELLDLALTHSPAAVMLSFGPPILFAARVKAAGAKLICQVQSMKHAREAVAASAEISRTSLAMSVSPIINRDADRLGSQNRIFSVRFLGAH